MKSIEIARNAETILMTNRNKETSTEWLREVADIDAPDFRGRCLHAGCRQ
jgi:hypothetical protein